MTIKLYPDTKKILTERMNRRRQQELHQDPCFTEDDDVDTPQTYGLKVDEIEDRFADGNDPQPLDKLFNR